MSEIGHNGGPPLEGGHGFRKLAWKKARAELLPSLPLQIIRLRVERAKRLGLPYQTYATIRATSGRDIVGFLFSGNALDLRPGRIHLPPDSAARLVDLPAGRLAAIYAPATPEPVLRANAGLLDAAAQAPDLTATWRETRERLRALLRERALPLDGVVLVPATAIEAGWTGTAGLAGSVPAAAFFDRPEGAI